MIFKKFKKNSLEKNSKKNFIFFFQKKISKKNFDDFFSKKVISELSLA